MDTDLNRYEVTQGWPWGMSFHPGQSLIPEFKIFGMKVPLQGSSRVGAERKEKPKTKKIASQKNRIPMHAWFDLMKKITRCFTLRKFELIFDTDDVVLNAQLIPVAFFISNQSALITPNFYGRGYLHLEVTGYPYKIIWTLSKFFIKKQILWK